MAGTPPAAVATAIAREAGNSIIASDLVIKGQGVHLVSRGRLQVDGEVHGNIDGRDVTIGQSGSVVGVVTAQSIEVRGQIKGSLRGANVTLQPSARVDGDIVEMVLVIQEGAHFDGNVRRAKDAAEVAPSLGEA